MESKEEKMKRLIKQTKRFVGTSLILPVGAKAVTALGGSGAGVAAFSGQMPMIGRLIPTAATLRLLKKLNRR